MAKKRSLTCETLVIIRTFLLLPFSIGSSRKTYSHGRFIVRAMIQMTVTANLYCLKQILMWNSTICSRWQPVSKLCISFFYFPQPLFKSFTVTHTETHTLPWCYRNVGTRNGHTSFDGYGHQGVNRCRYGDALHVRHRLAYERSQSPFWKNNEKNDIIIAAFNWLSGG